MSRPFLKVAESRDLREGDRLHVRIDGRYVTLFRRQGRLHALDSICHHAGGPLTQGPVQDIEELGVAVVLCPWHRFMVTLDGGLKAYQGVEIIGGKPVRSGWKLGKMVQRAHLVEERDDGIYLSLALNGEDCVSDNDACSALCAQSYTIHYEGQTRPS